MDFSKPLGLAMGLVALNAVDTMNANSVDATKSGDHPHDSEVVKFVVAIITATFAVCTLLFFLRTAINKVGMRLRQALPAFPAIKALCRPCLCLPRAKNGSSQPDRLAEEGLTGSLGQGEPQPGPANEMALPTSPPPVYGSWVNDSSVTLPKYSPEVGQAQHSDPPSPVGSSRERDLSPLEQHRQSYYEEQREHILTTPNQ